LVNLTQKLLSGIHWLSPFKLVIFTRCLGV
jgi:hypothetical protein